MPHIRLIGDVHGIVTARMRGRTYFNLIQDAQYTVQLGDFGFDYRPLSKVDATRHRIIAGNHEHYEAIDSGKFPHFLGDFGIHSIPLEEGEFKFFFIRGAYSIDKHLRAENLDWFRQEELNYEQATQAVKLYEATKPDIVMSHECPREILPFISRSGKVFDPSYTQKLLQTLYEIHRPKLWIFGHHHRNWKLYYSGVGQTITGVTIDNGPRPTTVFVCLNELGYLDIDKQGNIGQPQ